MAFKLTATTWIIWGIALIAQNASFTWITRARASNSLWQHGISTVVAQLISFLTGLIALDNSIRILQGKNWTLAFLTLAFYTCCNLGGGVGMHWALMQREKPKPVNAEGTKEMVGVGRGAKA